MFSIRVALLFTSFLSLPVGARSPSVLLSETDTVVIGTEFNPVQAGSTFTFNLKVDRVMRGDAPNGATLNVVWNSRYKAQLGDSSLSFRGIWFLKKAVNGTWECISAGATGNAEFFPQLSLPVSDKSLPAELAFNPETTPLSDQIILETAAGTPRANRRVLGDVAAGVRSPGLFGRFVT